MYAFTHYFIIEWAQWPIHQIYTASIHIIAKYMTKTLQELIESLIFRTSNVMGCTPKRYVRFLKDHIKVGASK